MTYSEMISNFFTRTVDIKFSDRANGAKILRHVLGQMSDGIWEESNAITGYWLCAVVNGNGNLQISTTYGSPESYHKCKNPYRRMNDDAIRSYFANKIKQVVRINLKDNYEADVRRNVYARHELEDSWLIPAAKYDEYRAATEEIEQYLEEHPFNFRNLFNENNNTGLVYLSDYKEAEIRVSDAYKAYKSLLTAQGEEQTKINRRN